MALFAFFSTVCNLLLSFVAFYRVALKLSGYKQQLFILTLLINHVTLASWLFYFNEDRNVLLLSGFSLAITGALIFVVVLMRISFGRTHFH
ncbi:MAG: hypothetical protein WBA74_16490 [Cyclobacteriaceae bacterium]